MTKKVNLENRSTEKNLDDEIDLRILLSIVLRNKFLIGTVTFCSFVVACLFSLSLKKVWEGQFQIVLNDSNQAQIINPTLSNLIGNKNASTNLRTQVGILQSPSVLMPIYELVNGENTKDLINQIPFSKWKKNLEVELQRDTSILNIAYRDTNKEIILPALNKMSLIYQDYSKRGEEREQKMMKKYLLSQIDLFKQKSLDSVKSAQNFAIDQDLIYLGSDNPSEKLNSEDNEQSLKNRSSFRTEFLGTNLNIENVRVTAANEIRLINLQIEKINDLNQNDYENLQYFGSSIPALSSDGLPQTLKTIERELVVLRTQYTDKDESIIRLLEQRNSTINLLKSRAIKYLKIAKLEAEARMEAAMRPKGVLLKYKELLREASRDEATLVSLENDLRLLELEKAKTIDPWELITQPTLLKNPVAPSRRLIGFYGLIVGGFLGILISLAKEIKAGKVYSKLELERAIALPLIEIIYKVNNFSDSMQISFLKEYLNNQKEKRIVFITLEDKNQSYLQKLKKFLINQPNLDKEIELVSSKNTLEKCKNTDFIILFATPGISSYLDIENLKSRFKLLNINFKGFIILND